MSSMILRRQTDKVEVRAGDKLNTRSWGEVTVVSFDEIQTPDDPGRVVIEFNTGRQMKTTPYVIGCEFHGPRPWDRLSQRTIYMAAVPILIEAVNEEDARAKLADFLSHRIDHNVVAFRTYVPCLDTGLTRDDYKDSFG